MAHCTTRNFVPRGLISLICYSLRWIKHLEHIWKLEYGINYGIAQYTKLGQPNEVFFCVYTCMR